MIPKRHKFSRRLFEGSLKRMKSFRHGSFLFLFRPHPRASFAVVISRKVCKKAVERNKFRREMYAFLREYLLEKTSPLQLIVLYKGRQINQNGQDALAAVQDFTRYYQRKFPSDHVS